MQTDKTILFIIVVTFIFAGMVQMSSTDDITFEQYLKVRYIMAIAIIDTTNPQLSCGWINVTRKIDDETGFNATLLMLANDQLYIQKTEGQIVDSELHYNSKLSPKSDLFCTVTSHSDGKEMIIFPKDHSFDRQFALLLSQSPSLTKATKLRFEEMSATENLRVVYIEHNNCTYKPQ